MNILHHKSWHVRTKENIRKVRKDEAEAAEKERRELERQINVVSERRLKVLREQADKRLETDFDIRPDANPDAEEEPGTSGGHINFFADLERNERKNLGGDNEEYKQEKAKEKDEWEQKMGILVKLGQDTNELTKKKEWYEVLPKRPKELSKPERLVFPPAPKKDAKDDDDEEGRKSKKDKKQKKEKKRKKDKKEKHNKKRKRSRSSSSDSSANERKKRKSKQEIEEDVAAAKKARIAELREERLRREREERGRSWRVLHPELAKADDERKEREKPKYNSGFNPHLARR
ncbi:unnamed protein product, partial [Mesorhabditis spiculigera]